MGRRPRLGLAVPISRDAPSRSWPTGSAQNLLGLESSGGLDSSSIIASRPNCSPGSGGRCTPAWIRDRETRGRTDSGDQSECGGSAQPRLHGVGPARTRRGRPKGVMSSTCLVIRPSTATPMGTGNLRRGETPRAGGPFVPGTAATRGLPGPRVLENWPAADGVHPGA